MRTYLPAGLKAWYPMGEANGANRLNQLAPGANILTQHATVTQVAGPGNGIDHATGFVGSSSQYLSNAGVAGMLETGVWSAWFVIKGLAADNPSSGIFALNDAAGDDYVGISVDTRNGKLTLSPFAGGNTNNQYVESESDPEIDLGDGNWHGILAVMDGTSLNVMIDGLKQACTCSIKSWTATGNPALVLGSKAGPSSYFTGSICTLGIWNRALGGGDSLTLYNGGKFTVFPS